MYSFVQYVWYIQLYTTVPGCHCVLYEAVNASFVHLCWGLYVEGTVKKEKRGRWAHIISANLAYKKKLDEMVI